MDAQVCAHMYRPAPYADVKCCLPVEGSDGTGRGRVLSHSCHRQMLCLCSRTDHLYRKPRALCQSAETEGRELGPGSSRGGGGGVGMLLQTAVPGAGYLVHSPPLEREQDTLRLRDSSTQHVRDKQFIFLPQLLTEGNIRCH